MKTKDVILITMGLLLFYGCVEEMRDKGTVAPTNKEIRFQATDYEAIATRSAEDDDQTGRMFLGMAGKDSLFLCASESPIVSKPMAVTKAEGTTIPKSFHISAFKDNAANPYLTLKLTSQDNWQTYSPMLYWPYEYDYIHFFAWSYNLGDNLINPVFTTGTSFKAEFDYTIPHSSDDDNDAEVQPDITVAISPSQDETKEPVELDFVHTLAAIEFKIGNIGDATVVSSTTELTGILSEGHCTVTAPVSPENIKWEYTNDRNSYTQTIKEGVPFMIIPQKLTDTEVSFNMTVTIGDIKHSFPAKKLADITPEWKANKKYTYTITKGGEVKVDVRDSNTNTVKNNVKIQNSGFTTSYIRAAIVGYWYVVKDGVEEIAAAWDINDGNVGTLTKASDWNEHWKLVDGFYYHLDPVEPGEYTAPLFDRYELIKTTGPVSGSKLNISIAVQAVENNKAEEVWPVIQ